MNLNGRTLQLNMSGLGCWITLFAVIWLLGAVGLGWIVKSVFVLLVFMILAPMLAFLGLRWWVKRNLVTGACPVCQAELTGMTALQMSCPSCGEPLVVENGAFHRRTAPGTIDVEVMTVEASPVEPHDTVTTIPIEAMVLPPDDEDETTY